MITADEVTDFIGDPFLRSMNAEGITPEYLAKKLKEELNATKDEQYPDWKIRQEARKDAHKLRNDYPPERSEVTGADGVPLIPRIEIVLVRPDGPTG